MYTSQDEKRLYEQAKHLLNYASDDIEKYIQELREVIHYSNYKYYNQDNPIISDFEYDVLFKKLKDLEEKFPEYASADSPTEQVGSPLFPISTTTTTTTIPVSGRLPPVEHLLPMLSLDNTYNADDLRKWDQKCKKLTNKDLIVYCIEPKFDGASISLVYKNDSLIRAATRGDGVVGEDITLNAKQIESIPQKASFSKMNLLEVEVRGEVVMTKAKFNDFNRNLIENNLPPLANPRNAASGTLRIKNPQEVSKRGLEAYIYQIGYTDKDHNLDQYDAIEFLNSIGFRTSELNYEICCFDNIEDVIEFANKFEQQRDSLPYEIDGLVVKVDDHTIQDQLGMTSHHPRWAVAYKFKARQATSKLLDVDYQVGRTGTITPVAKIAPVSIGGVTVTSVSLFNEDVIKKKDLRVGDTVLVERAGDVIPYIVKPLTELRTGEEQPIIFRKDCPVCRGKLERVEGEAVWRCINISCPAQVVERIIHFASKDAMDIRNLGGANVLKFFELGLLKDIPGIYNINWDEIRKLGGFGEKSITNLQTAIDNSKTQPLNRVIFGLGIRHVGETMAKTLANSVEHIRDLYERTEEELVTLEDVGPKVAASVAHFFKTPENRHMIDMLEKAGVNLENHHKGHKEGTGELAGKTFLFTGTLSQFKRSDAEALVEEKGGSLLSGVSSKLNYLVVGTDAGSKLEKARKLGTITILNEDEFLALIHK